MSEKIGLIGVGMMGHGIASSLSRHGRSLVLLDHPGNQPLDRLIEAGAATTTSPKELTGQVDILILCVTGSREVEDILYKDDGVLAGLRAGTAIIDCSTAIPSSTLRIAAAIEQKGGLFLDAPMTRTPKEAAEGRLNLIVGGKPDVFDRYRPLLECFAENIVFAGPAGSGHRLKLLHNFVSLGFSAVLAEAAACAARADVDPAVLMEVLSKGGGAGVILDRMGPFIERQDGSGFRFSIANSLKDLTYYTTMASELGAADLAAQAIRATYEAASHSDRPHATVPELIAILSESKKG